MWSFEVLLLFSLGIIVTQCSVVSEYRDRRSMNMNKRPDIVTYNKVRAEILEESLNKALGSDIQLNDKEMRLNEILMELKMDEYNQGFENPFNFTPSRHFFDVVHSVKESPLFQLIQKMPKGGVLHAHDTAICSTDYVVSLTKWDNLWQWGDLDGDELPKFLFANKRPESIDGTEWRLASDVRKVIGDKIYDAKARPLFTLLVDNPTEAYKDINAVWTKFNHIFMVFGALVTYTEVWKDYFRQALQEMYDDGVQLLEFRGVLPETYDLDGNTYGPIETVQMYVDVLKEFKSTHTDFVGAKFIYAPVRLADDESFDKYLPILTKLMKTFPDFVVGFDLVGQEDAGRPLKDYVERLLEFPANVQFFWHAGETNWLGTESDENLIDAILLGAKRIGHGFAIVKYPTLLKMIKKRKICLEINPISNQVLKLVDDFRNHPSAILFSDDYPIVISSDDPSFWEATPLSHDFYFAFLGIASAKQDLRTLKKLILNSFEYSSLNRVDKLSSTALWMKSWYKFVEHYVDNYDNQNEVINIV
ncbi:unnamed protein product [Diamesa tonsa]